VGIKRMKKIKAQVKSEEKRGLSFRFKKV